ncbi:MAG: MFS transporter [Gammaproteobacteria bacterium]|nr:MFS transporter [Gammaproteobacteria bacterium]
MNHWLVKTSLFLNYFVFAILLNSVGTVILQVQNTYGVSESAASILEAFKDLPIAITSFLLASYIVRIGYRRTMLMALGFVTLTYLAMPQLPVFWMTKAMFAATGVGFALIKVSVFASLGLVTGSRKQHASLMNFLESFFMVGVLSGYFIFSAFIDDADPSSLDWLNVYYLLAAMSAVAFALLFIAGMDESSVQAETSESRSSEFLGMLKLCIRPLVIVFVISAFLYVLIEQSIMSWLPTFNSRILNLAPSLSIQMASILAAATALGRFSAGIALRKFDWFKVLVAGLAAAVVLVLVALPLAKGGGGAPVTQWSGAPFAAFVFPLIGFCIAPIYPAINSVILSALPARQHGSMAGLIVVFSALGGTSGSIIMGYLFESVGGQSAFYFSLLPIGAIVITLFFFKRFSDSHLANGNP